MGNILKSASIDITTAFDENKAAADSKRLQNTINKSAEELRKEREKELDLLLKEQKLDAEQVAKLKARLDSKTFTEELNTEKRLHNIRLKDAQEVARANKAASEKISGAISGIGGAVNSPLGGLQAALGKIPIVGAAAAAAIGVLTLGISKLANGAIKTGAAFEHQVNTFQAITNASNEERARVEAAAQDIGATTKWSASQAMQGMNALGRGGLTPDQAIEVARSATNLATAQDVSIEAAGSLVVETAHQYGLDTSESERIADVTTSALSGSNQNLQDFQEALKYCGVGLHQAGVSFEESAAMVMTLADVGVKGSSAGNALKSLTARLNANKDKLEALGVSVSDAQGNFRALPDILADLKKYTSTLSATESAAFYKDTFGAYFANPISALVNNVDKVNANIDTLVNSSGATARAVETMSAGPLAKIVGIGSKLEALGIMLEKALRPITSVILNSIDNFISGFMGGITPYLQELKAIWAGFTAGLGDGGFSKLLGQVVAFCVGELATLITDIAKVVADCFGGLKSIIDILKALLHHFASGLEEKAARADRLEKAKDYNAAYTSFREATSKYKEAKAAGVTGSELAPLAKEVRSTAVRYQNAAKAFQKSALNWKDLAIENTPIERMSGALKDEISSVNKTLDALPNALEKIGALLNNKELADEILQGIVQTVDAASEEEQESTAAADIPTGFTEEQAARFAQAERNELERGIKKALDEEVITAEVANDLTAKLDSKEGRQYARNELESFSALARSTQEERLPEAKESKQFKEYGLDVTEDDVRAFSALLRNGFSFDDLAPLAKLDTSRTVAPAVTTAFGEVNYNNEYKNKVYSYLEKLTAAARSIDDELKNDRNDRQTFYLEDIKP